MLTEGMVEQARETASQALPDKATIYRRTTENEGGEVVETWSVHASSDCRISPVGGGETGEEGARVAEETTHIVTFPAGTDIEEADRIAIDGVAYNPTLVRKRGSWEITRRVEVKESVEGIPDLGSGSGDGS